MALFDNLGKKLTQTGQEAVSKTKNVAETVKINMAISDNEKVLAANYTKLGQAYYEKYADGGWDSDFDEIFGVVADAKTQIEVLEEQVRQLRGIVLCTNCGAELSEGMAFCGKCGERLSLVKAPAEEPEPAADAAKCESCGAELEADAVFCASCGQKREQ